jgi:hypothetical protein
MAVAGAKAGHRPGANAALPQVVTRLATNVTCECPKDRQPVCSVEGFTFDNACMTLCNSQAVAADGVCAPKARSANCTCPAMTPSPVCGMDLKTYPSSCQAGCQGVRPTAAAATCAHARAALLHVLDLLTAPRHQQPRLRAGAPGVP